MPIKQPIIHVLHPGLFTTVQDLGRRGYQRFGVSVSGAMDPWALTVGNRLLGNPDRAAGLEITLHGPELLFEQALSIAITGADLSPTSDGLAIPLWTVVTMKAGSRLQFGMRRQGARFRGLIAATLPLPIAPRGRPRHAARRASKKRSCSASFLPMPILWRNVWAGGRSCCLTKSRPILIRSAARRCSNGWRRAAGKCG